MIRLPNKRRSLRRFDPADLLFAIRCGGSDDTLAAPSSSSPSHEHQYRAYLTFLRVVLDTQSGILLFNAPVRNLNWFVDSGWGMRFERLGAEIERIEKYSALGHLASADEVIEYQKWKESFLKR